MSIGCRFAIVWTFTLVCTVTKAQRKSGILPRTGQAAFALVASKSMRTVMASSCGMRVSRRTDYVDAFAGRPTSQRICAR